MALHDVTLSGSRRGWTSLSKFLVLFVVQAAVLIVVVALCYQGLARLRQGLERLGGDLPRATVVAEVLHYSDVLRVVHVSLIGAATNAEYVDVRLKRLKEVEDTLEASIVRMEALPWSPSDRKIITSVAAGMRAYSQAFPPLLEQSRKATPKELPELIQANTAYRRDAYNMLLDMLPRLQKEAEAVVAANLTAFRRVELAIFSGLILTVILGIWLFRLFFVHTHRTRRQADELNRSMHALSNGDLSTTCAVISGDELGRVAENLNRIFEILARNIRTIMQISSKLESVVDVVGSRSRTVIGSAQKQGEAVDKAYFSIGNLNNGIHNIMLNVDSLSAASEETSASTLELVASMEEVARNTDTLFESVEDAASSTHEMVTSITEVDRNVDFLMNFTTDTSSSMVEMSNSIAEVERNASRSRDLARMVCEAAESGMNAVRETIEGMDEIRRAVQATNGVVEGLGQRSVEIDRIVNVIDDIARQTNLLALNAAILAAQAGEHGSGFSVVATEIRDLSERTAKSTSEIGEMVRGVQREVGNALRSMGSGAESVDGGVRLAGGAGEVLHQILDSAQKSLDMIGRIATAMEEQAMSGERIAATVTRVQDMVRQINAATNQQATGSEHILKSVEQMRDVTKSVRSASAEQKSSTGMISHAAEQMIEMVRQISGIAADQAAESEKIVGTMQEVRAIADGNSSSAKEMNDSVALLAEAIAELEGEIGKFKVYDDGSRGATSLGIRDESEERFAALAGAAG